MLIKQEQNYRLRKKAKLGMPRASEGLDGDLELRITKKGVGLFGKVRERWFLFGTLRQLSNLGSTGDASMGKETVSLNEYFELDGNVLKVKSIAGSKTKTDLITLNENTSINGKITVSSSATIGGDLQVNGNNIAFDAATSQIGVDAAAHDTAGQGLTIKAGDTTAGTTINQVGGDLIFQGGRGKGSAAGGYMRFYVSDGAATGSNLNNVATALVIADNKDTTFYGDITVSAGESGNAQITLSADESDDNGDDWTFLSVASDNTLAIQNDISGSDVSHLTLVPHATVASSSATFAGSLAVKGTDGIIAGAVIWESFPFIASSIVASRGFYFRDNDDPEDFRKWDEFDADMVLVYGRIYGHYVVPEDCTLNHMRGIVANDGGTDNVIINIWYCLQTDIETDTTSTTFTKAGSDETVVIGTDGVGVQFDEDYDVDLTAGSIIIPTLKNASGVGGASFLGSLTLKFITR